MSNISNEVANPAAQGACDFSGAVDAPSILGGYPIEFRLDASEGLAVSVGADALNEGRGELGICRFFIPSEKALKRKITGMLLQMGYSRPKHPPLFSCTLFAYMSGQEEPEYLYQARVYNEQISSRVLLELTTLPYELVNCVTEYAEDFMIGGVLRHKKDRSWEICKFEVWSMEEERKAQELEQKAYEIEEEFRRFGEAKKPGPRHWRPKVLAPREAQSKPKRENRVCFVSKKVLDDLNDAIEVLPKPQYPADVRALSDLRAAIYHKMPELAVTRPISKEYLRIVTTVLRLMGSHKRGHSWERLQYDVFGLNEQDQRLCDEEEEKEDAIEEKAATVPSNNVNEKSNLQHGSQSYRDAVVFGDSWREPPTEVKTEVQNLLNHEVASVVFQFLREPIDEVEDGSQKDATVIDKEQEVKPQPEAEARSKKAEQPQQGETQHDLGELFTQSRIALLAQRMIGVTDAEQRESLAYTALNTIRTDRSFLVGEEPVNPFDFAEQLNLQPGELVAEFVRRAVDSRHMTRRRMQTDEFNDANAILQRSGWVDTGEMYTSFTAMLLLTADWVHRHKIILSSVFLLVVLSHVLNSGYYFTLYKSEMPVDNCTFVYTKYNAHAREDFRLWEWRFMKVEMTTQEESSRLEEIGKTSFTLMVETTKRAFLWLLNSGQETAELALRPVLYLTKMSIGAVYYSFLGAFNIYLYVFPDSSYSICWREIPHSWSLRVAQIMLYPLYLVPFVVWAVSFLLILCLNIFAVSFTRMYDATTQYWQLLQWRLDNHMGLVPLRGFCQPAQRLAPDLTTHPNASRKPPRIFRILRFVFSLIFAMVVATLCWALVSQLYFRP